MTPEVLLPLIGLSELETGWREPPEVAGELVTEEEAWASQ